MSAKFISLHQGYRGEKAQQEHLFQEQTKPQKEILPGHSDTFSESNSFYFAGRTGVSPEKNPAESPCRANDWKMAGTGLLKKIQEEGRLFALLQHGVFCLSVTKIT